VLQRVAACAKEGGASGVRGVLHAYVHTTHTQHIHAKLMSKGQALTFQWQRPTW